MSVREDKLTWFPNSTRCDQLDKNLDSLKSRFSTQSISVRKVLVKASETIKRLAEDNVVPHYYLRDLIWIGSQFRLANENIKIRSISGALLYYIISKLNEPVVNGEALRKDLNYLISSTFSEVYGLTDKQELKGFLSSSELNAIDQFLNDQRAKDTGIKYYKKEELDSYLHQFDDVASEVYLPGIRPLIHDLVVIAGKNSDAIEARVALEYLLEEHDVVPDTLGYFGLVDDIYVLEQARLNVTDQTTWEPLLDQIIKRNPFLMQLGFLENGNSIGLTPYMKLICGSAIDSALDPTAKNCIVMPEVGPLGITSAFLACLVFITEAIEGSGNSLSKSKPGDYVFLDFGKRPIMAKYINDLEHEGTYFSALKFQDGSITVNKKVVNLLRKASSPHKRLSKVSHYYEWRKNNTPDPLKFITKDKYKISNTPKIVIYLTKRNKLENYRNKLLPMGETISDLVGLKYISSTGREDEYGGSFAGVPLIWCCSDAIVASEIIMSDEFNSIGMILIDDGDLAVQFEQTESASTKQNCFSRTAMISLEQVNPTRDLLRDGYVPWLFNRKDITPNISRKLINPANPKGPLSTFQQRTYQQENVEREFHIVKQKDIEELFEVLLELKIQCEADEEDSLVLVSLVLSQFIRRYLANFFPTTRSQQEELNSLLRNVLLEANTLVPYHPELRQLIEKCENVLSVGIPQNPKYDFICKILEKCDRQKIAIMCSSKATASSYETSSAKLEIFKNVHWLVASELDHHMPFDLIIVPGWLQTRLMRRIRVSGCSRHISYVLFNFEEKWERRSKSSASGWEDRIGSMVASNWPRIENKYGKIPSPSFIHSDRSTVVSPKEPERDTPDFDWMTNRVVNTVRNHVNSNPGITNLVMGHLTIFEDASTYTILPPHGRVVSIGKALRSTSGKTHKDVEKIISCPVNEISQGDILAFPISQKSDLIGEIADKLLPDNENIRDLASLWRTALIEFIHQKHYSIKELKFALKVKGLDRHVFTLKNWIETDHIIAPLGWESAIQIIAEITRYEPLVDQIPNVANAIKTLYEARQKAAGLFLKELSQSDVNIENGVLNVIIENMELKYLVMRVLSIDPPISIPRDQIGKIKTIVSSQLVN